MNGFSDDILVAATIRGDKKAYAILVERYYESVFAFCLGMLANVHDAEDIAQDALLQGFLKIRSLRDNKKFDKWLLKIAGNLCIDFLRRKKRIKLFNVEPKIPLQEKRCESCDLKNAVRKLPIELRLPLVMHYFNSENIKSIADRLDISNSSVWQRLRAARKQLHKLLTQEVQK